MIDSVIGDLFFLLLVMKGEKEVHPQRDMQSPLCNPPNLLPLIPLLLSLFYLSIYTQTYIYIERERQGEVDMSLVFIGCITMMKRMKKSLRFLFLQVSRDTQKRREGDRRRRSLKVAEQIEANHRLERRRERKEKRDSLNFLRINELFAKKLLKQKRERYLSIYTTIELMTITVG